MRYLVILLITLIVFPCYGMKVGRSVTFKNQRIGDISPESGQRKTSIGQSTELNRQFDEIVLALSGRIAFCDGDISNGEKGENIDGVFLVFTSLGADAQNTIAHSLDRVPSGYIVVSQNKAGSLYHALTDTAWTSSNIYLKSSVATVIYTIFIF